MVSLGYLDVFLRLGAGVVAGAIVVQGVVTGIGFLRLDLKAKVS